MSLAKLASAFQLLVFIFTDVALVAFRESRLDSYNPEYTSPGYPWVQLFGIIGGLVLLTQMGPLAIGGAVAIIVAVIAWYFLYGRSEPPARGRT